MDFDIPDLLTHFVRYSYMKIINDRHDLQAKPSHQTFENSRTASRPQSIEISQQHSEWLFIRHISLFLFIITYTRRLETWSEVITTNKVPRRGIGIRHTQLLNAINRNFVTIPRTKCPYAVSCYSFSLFVQSRNLKCNQQDTWWKA